LFLDGWLKEVASAEKRFRKIRGYREIPLLIQALRRERIVKESTSQKEEVA
jgi:hypothetical protein